METWNQAIAPSVALRRRGVRHPPRSRRPSSVLFEELAERFADRPGGYTRVVRLAQVRLGDAGRKAIIEFTGERDRAKGGRRRAAPVVADKAAKS